MSLKRKISDRQKRRKLRVRNSLDSSNFPRISVFRSLNHIYAQIIQDNNGVTLASYSSLELLKNPEQKNTKDKKSKKDIAYTVGQELAKKAQAQGITQAIFDRGSFLYHGRVKSLAEGIREGGIKI